MRPVVLACLLVLLLVAPATAADEALLLRMPDVGATQVAFVHANDIWIAPRDGGEARRLTTFAGAETHPHISPDGTLVAFSGEYDGNTDVYVVPTRGGEPQRLTWHPLPDEVRGWTPDGTRVVFASGRTGAPRPQPALWTIGLGGGLPEILPLPRAENGVFSPDGKRLAYQVVQQWDGEWRNYRGGQCNPVRVIDLATLEVERLPWRDSNDVSPAWLDDTVFFLSDRDWAMNVWAWNAQGGEPVQRTFFKDFDCKNLSGAHGRLVFENGGRLWTMDTAGGEPRALRITLSGDFPWARPHWTDAVDLVQGAGLSPTGKRAVFEARGEIFTVPAEKGDVRNLTASPGSAERAPAWSPDGLRISWFSDAGGEYRLVIADQFGKVEKTIALANPTFYYTPRWSPDGKHLAFGDADRSLWVVEVATGTARLVGNEGFATPARLIYPEWSPDSRWLAYSKRLPNQFNAVFVHSLETGRSTQVTDGLSDSHSPAWDRGGKHLYFLASTDYGLNVGWLDMSSYHRPLNYAIYVAVLDAAAPSPLEPQSDEEDGDEAKDEKKDEEKDTKKKDEAPVPVKIDFAGLDQRILALNVPARPYGDLAAGDEGVLFYTEEVPNQPGLSLHRYDLKEREAKPVTGGITTYVLSADGRKLLLGRPAHAWELADAAGEPKPGEGALDLGGLRLKVDPPAEWAQMFREAWRFQRDYFYVDNVHGLDLDWAWATYGPWLEHVRHRADLTYMLDILGGETAVGHSFARGGDEPDVDTVPVGLLGADFTVENGRYRLARIYRGENWNPDLRAPLSGPGLDVKQGEYLLAVNGVELTAGMNPYSLFDRTADRQTVLTLNSRPEPKGAREVTVVPVAEEISLRQREWMDTNRRKVDELSGGRLAYVWVPNTGGGGYTSFTRYYFAQQDKQGAVIDERFNQGGSIADYMVDIMSRRLLGYFNNPVGDRQPFTAPNAAIWGPKVMIINEMAGSGGDMLPYMFKLMEIGPLVGTRTWGGLVGIWDVPDLVDGGFITAPRGGFFDLEGEWRVENEGVAPDIEVEMEPKLVAEGRDPQLERAVAEALKLLETRAIELLEQPADPVRVRRPQ
ncbi:MAG: PD40 domain-containing protein [Krumholzibacteria bacterium]|nr:PD40 domain-containing protein [Candidatus Krumholzibacteria bacterium]